MYQRITNKDCVRVQTIAYARMTTIRKNHIVNGRLYKPCFFLLLDFVSVELCWKCYRCLQVLSH